MTQHLGLPIPSPAIMEKIGTRFRRAVTAFADAERIPIVRFNKGDRKLEVMRPPPGRAGRDRPVRGRGDRGGPGVPERVRGAPNGRHPTASRGSPSPRPTGGSPASTSTCGTPTSGPAFIKVCAYFPYPIKVWLNGHEWAKRQATQAGIGFTELSNGFATCDDPAALQAICDRLGPGTIDGVLRTLDEHAAAAAERRRPGCGYWWELSMRQIEVSRTMVFDAPRHARGFFEALVVDNLDVGPTRHRRADLPRPASTADTAARSSSAVRPRPRWSPATPRSP